MRYYCLRGSVRFELEVGGAGAYSMSDVRLNWQPNGVCDFRGGVGYVKLREVVWDLGTADVAVVMSRGCQCDAVHAALRLSLLLPSSLNDPNDGSDAHKVLGQKE